MVVQGHGMSVMAEMLRGVGLSVIHVKLWQSKPFGWLSLHNMLRKRQTSFAQQSFEFFLGGWFYLTWLNALGLSSGLRDLLAVSDCGVVPISDP